MRRTVQPSRESSLVALQTVRVLISGVSGFAGRHLAALALSRGAEVHGLVRPAGAGAPDGVIAHAIEISDRAAIAEVLARLRPDAVVHLAGASSVGRSFGDPLGTWDVNLNGTLAVLEGVRALDAPPRTLVVTSGEIYGRVPVEDLPVGPATPLTPLSPYGASKAAADLAAAQYHLGYDVPAIRVRAFNHIGPGQDERFVVPNVARQIAAAESRGDREVVVRVGNVSTRRDFTDVRDVVEAYWLLMHEGDPGTVYQPCSGRSRAVRELVDGLAALSTIDATIESDAALRREGEQEDLYGSPDTLRALGWSPVIPLERSLGDALDWWRARLAAG